MKDDGVLVVFDVVWNLAHCARRVPSNRHLDLLNDAGTLSRYRQTGYGPATKSTKQETTKRHKRKEKTRETTYFLKRNLEWLFHRKHL